MAKNNRRIGSSFVFFVLFALVLLGLVLAFLMSRTDIALLNPKGVVADQEHHLMIISTLTMLAFGVPVIAALYFFIWKYRESNQEADYTPPTIKNRNSYLLFAWGGPLLIAMVLASFLLPATQKLQPQKTIPSTNKQITIQVVALPWKWLFIYPDKNVASVNFAQIPVNTPVKFELTADNMPMSSFWIPHLSGMLYAMTGHVNQINMMGDTIGDYPGSSAEINGRGYAGMKFITRVSSEKDFTNWVNSVKKSNVTLDQTEYQKLLEPSENNKQAVYTSPSPNLYDTITSKYGEHQMEGMY